jgi:hypothetical protein
LVLGGRLQLGQQQSQRVTFRGVVLDLSDAEGSGAGNDQRPQQRKPGEDRRSASAPPGPVGRYSGVGGRNLTGRRTPAGIQVIRP